MGNCCGSQAKPQDVKQQTPPATADVPTTQQPAKTTIAQDQAPTTVDTPSEAVVDKKAKEEEHSQDIEAEYQKLMAAVDEHAKKRGEYFDQSKAAHEKGDGAAAKELSDKGKAEGKLMEEAKLKASKAMYQKVNKDHPEGTCDLHGQQVDPAMDLLETFITDMRSKGLKEVTVITGAGNHSDANGPKIKPKVHDYFKEKNMAFEEVNNGSIKVTL